MHPNPARLTFRMSAKILILDDEAEMRALLQRYLGSHGLSVHGVESAALLDRMMAREAFDLLILDLMLPGEDGLSLCRRMRSRGETIPILMLTARGDPVDRILGLEMGADDYLPKPFDPRELLARIQAMLRRQGMLGALPAVTQGATVKFGDCVLDLAARCLQRNETVLPLSSSEYAVLAALVAHAGRPLGRERLLAIVHGRDRDVTARSIDVTVLRLRRLIEVDPSSPRYLQTIWGVGYMFVPDGQTG